MNQWTRRKGRDGQSGRYITARQKIPPAPETHKECLSDLWLGMNCKVEKGPATFVVSCAREGGIF